MRKITEQTVNAFKWGTEFSSSNTRTDGKSIWLHGNRIAWKDSGGDLWIDSCGWNSNTTRERLNGLDGVRVITKQGQMYLNGKEWNGEQVAVKYFNK